MQQKIVNLSFQFVDQTFIFVVHILKFHFDNEIDFEVITDVVAVGMQF